MFTSPVLGQEWECMWSIVALGGCQQLGELTAFSHSPWDGLKLVLGWSTLRPCDPMLGFDAFILMPAVLCNLAGTTSLMLKINWLLLVPLPCPCLQLNPQGLFRVLVLSLPHPYGSCQPSAGNSVASAWLHLPLAQQLLWSWPSLSQVSSFSLLVLQVATNSCKYNMLVVLYRYQIV